MRAFCWRGRHRCAESPGRQNGSTGQGPGCPYSFGQRDLRRALLREGRVHGAEDWLSALEPGRRLLPASGHPPVFPRRCGVGPPGGLSVRGSGTLSVCHWSSRQPGIGAEDRVPAEAASGPAPNRPTVWYYDFLYQGWRLGQATAGGGEDQASGIGAICSRAWSSSQRISAHRESR